MRRNYIIKRMSSTIFLLILTTLAISQQDKHIDPSTYHSLYRLGFSKHVNTDFTQAQVDVLLKEGNERLSTCNNRVDDEQDVACKVTFERAGSLANFGTEVSLAKSLDVNALEAAVDVITTQAELDSVFAKPGFVKIVTAIKINGGYANGIAKDFGSSSMIIAVTNPSVRPLSEMGITFVHEFGHCQGLRHRRNADESSNPYDLKGNPIMASGIHGYVDRNEVNLGECEKFHNGYNKPLADESKPNRPVDLLFIIDDTGSMTEEINGVKNAINLALSVASIFISNSCNYTYRLITYKDAPNTTRPATTDLNTIKTQVSALFASGGGDCPEASGQALDIAQEYVKDGGLIFTATDASPRSGADIATVTARAKARGVKIFNILSGDCTSASLRATLNQGDNPDFYLSDNHDPVNGSILPSMQTQVGAISPSSRTLPTNPTAIEAFSYISAETGGVFSYVSEVNSGQTNDRIRYENIVSNIIIGAVSLAVTDLQPRKAPLNGVVAFTLNGTNTHFNSGASIAFSDPNVEVTELLVASPTLITGTLRIKTGTSIGFKDVSVTSPQGGGIIEIANGIGLLEVITTPTAPTILSISPATGTEGENLTVKVTGMNTNFGTTSVVNLGAGITVLSTTVLSSQELLANIQISPTANIGFRNVVVTTGLQIATENVVGPFLVVAFAGTNFYSKPTGNLSDLSTWGSNTDGSGTSPGDFGNDKTFNLVNRGGIYAMTTDWIVDGIINIPSGSQLRINNFTLTESTISGGGTLSGSALSNLVVTGSGSGDAGVINFTQGSNVLNQLTINRSGTLASATLGSPLNIQGVLTLTSGTFNTGNVLTLKSNALNTARVAPVTGSISGNVTVERYIPARRAWRVLAAPVGGSQTINAGWQEGAILGASGNPNPVPGFGTHITGGPSFGSVANGFDQNPGAASSLKRYNSSINNWDLVQNTNATNIGADAYMVFIRGNRGVALGNNSAPANNTTLRSNGPLRVGNQIFTVNPAGFTAIPNPYASPINFATITRSGVQNNFYLWDPKLGGANGVGAYVLLSDNGAGGYSIVPAPVSPESQFIQSGQGFLVRPTVNGTAGSITIKESDKSATAATDVFRTAGGVRPISANGPVLVSPETEQGLRIALKSSADEAIFDEVFASYKSMYSNRLDDLDAVKMDNMAENLAMINGSQSLMLERRQMPQAGDAIELKLWNTQPQAYTLQISAIELAGTSLQAVLEDRYLKTVTPINLGGKSQISFTVDANSSSAGNRFRVLFTKEGADILTTLPKGISAYPNPLEGEVINLSFNDKAKGTYQVVLTNSAGQVVFRKAVQHAGGVATQPLNLGRKPLKGIYRLQVTSNSGEATAISITCQ